MGTRNQGDGSRPLLGILVKLARISPIWNSRNLNRIIGTGVAAEKQRALIIGGDPERVGAGDRGYQVGADAFAVVFCHINRTF